MCIYVLYTVYMHAYIHTYIHTYIDRERERYIYIYIYRDIYIYIYLSIYLSICLSLSLSLSVTRCLSHLLVQDPNEGHQKDSERSANRKRKKRIILNMLSYVSYNKCMQRFLIKHVLKVS